MKNIRKIKSLLKKVEYTEQDLNFVGGKAIIKDGRRTVAKIYDRKIFYKENNMKQQYSEEYPYMLEIPNLGSRECSSIEECLIYVNKYL